jgi:hypothetical protein
LGWAAGLFALVLFFAISLWCALMLTEVYKVSCLVAGHAAALLQILLGLY